MKKKCLMEKREREKPKNKRKYGTIYDRYGYE